MIYHFNLAYLDGMSGGDRCTLELIRHFAARGIENTLLTTERGRARFVAEGLEESRFCRYLVIPDFDPGAGGLSILTAYIRRLRPAFRLVDELSLEDGDLIYCHNEFFPNLLPCNRLAARSPEIRLIYHLHMLAPDLWRGYQGQFTGEFHWPSLRLINYRIQQYIFRKTVPERALVVYNNAYYDQTISKWFPANKRYNIERYSGVDLAETPAVGKSYDLVWCGRFHAQKGVDKIPEMVGLLKERKPDISLAVIGSGAPWEERLRRDIERRGLQRNIELKGFLEGPEKFAVFKSARIFLMTSLYESFGQVILEAMKCGLPVVAYDLPVYEVFKAGMVKVDPLDNTGMCAEILDMLSNDDNYAALAEAAIHFAQQFSWSITADEISKLISD